MVKVTKWDRKKKKEDWAKYRKDQSKIKYKISENMRYILAELWKSHPLMFVLIFAQVIALVVESLFTTFTGKLLLSLPWEHHQGSGLQ